VRRNHLHLRVHRHCSLLARQGMGAADTHRGERDHLQTRAHHHGVNLSGGTTSGSILPTSRKHISGANKAMAIQPIICITSPTPLSSTRPSGARPATCDFTWPAPLPDQVLERMTFLSRNVSTP